jgi:hypothetical protein
MLLVDLKVPSDNELLKDHVLHLNQAVHVQSDKRRESMLPA